MILQVRNVFFLLAVSGVFFCFGGEPSRDRFAYVLKSLDLDRPGLAAVKNARGDKAKLAALLQYFKNRPQDVKARSRKFEPNASEREQGDAALEHRFTGQRAYGLVPRGTPIDWDDPHTKDREWLWQFHRFIWWKPLGVCYRAAKDEKYAREWASEINAWCDHMFNAKGYPVDHPGWRNLEVGKRIENWAAAYFYFSDSEALDGETLVNFLFSVKRHCSRLDGPCAKVTAIGNWQVLMQRALLAASLQFPEFRESAAWTKNAIDRLKLYQKTVMMPDGVISEFSPNYHTIYPETFYSARQAAREAGLQEDFGAEYDQLIQNGVTAIMIWNHPDGTAPLFGDAGQWQKSRKYVGTFCKRYPERKDWLWFATEGREGRDPGTHLNSLPDAGFHTMRTDWSTAPAVFLIAKNSFDAKEQYHNQPDNMTFELSFGGKRVMLDSGGYIYRSLPEARAWFAASARHQTVTLNGENNARAGKLLFQKEGANVMVTAMENPARADLLHRRLIFVVGGKFVAVLDLLSGKAEGELRCHYQFNEGRYDFNAEALRAFNGDLLLVGAPSNGAMVEEEGWISRSYAKKEPRPAFAFVQKKKADESAAFLTLIVPASAGKNASIRFDGKDQNAFLIEAAGEAYRITFDVAKAFVACRKI